MPTKSLSYRIGERVVRVVTPMLMRVRESGGTNLPADGACIVVANHLSHADPFVVAYVLTGHRRLPRFLAKASLMDLPVVGPLLTGAGQIPVFRESADAVGALQLAENALRDGECVVVYPEGTLTRDPSMWPMRGKLGAARLALATGAPLIPLVHWGVHEVLPPYGKVPRVFRRPEVRVRIGPAIDVTAFRPDFGAEPGLKDLMRANAAIENELVRLVAELRGEPAPATLWNPRAHGQTSIGNPAKLHTRPNVFTRGRAAQQRLVQRLRALRAGSR